MFAPAKVNLFLHVTGRRADGYHLLDSVAVFPAVGDVLRAVAADGLSLEVVGPFGLGLTQGPDNLVLRAGHALAQAAGIDRGARIVLEKRLPVASGIGGGSADAAAALRLLCKLWDVRPDAVSLHEIASSLGADVAVCLASVPSRMSGIGDILAPAPATPAFGIVLANPGLPVSTPAVFRSRGTGYSPPAALPECWPDVHAMARDMELLGNDLQVPAIALCPTIAEVLRVLANLPGCLLARMSGSGATCFALFADAAAARLAAVAADRPGWWAWGGAGLAETAACT